MFLSNHITLMAAEIHWITTADDFLPWHDAWLDLLNRSVVPITPFHHPAWIDGCWRCPRNQLAVGLLATGRDLHAGLVFNSETDAGPAVLVPIRLLSLTPHISAAHPACLVAVAHPAPDPGDIGLLLDLALDALKWQALFLNFLNPAHTWLETAVRSAAAARHWRIREGQSSTDAYIDATGGSSAYLARRSSNFQNNQRRARNQLRNLGSLEMMEVARTDMPRDALETVLTSAFERCWQRDSIHSPLHPAVRPSLLSLLAAMRTAGLLRVYLLRSNSTDIAFEFGFVDPYPGGLYYPCVRGYDETYKKYSPGNLLTEFTLDDTAASRLRGIYLGPIHVSADTKYKQTWLTEEWTVRNFLLIRPKSIYGILDTLYERIPVFRRLWWKFRIGEHIRKRYWKHHGPTG